MRAIVRMERRVELCCEGSRWSDIRRWKIVEQLPEMCGDDYGMNFAGINSQEFYKRTVFQTRVWKKAMYWLPVYIDEMNKNTNLVQAPSGINKMKSIIMNKIMKLICLLFLMSIAASCNKRSGVLRA